MQIKLIKIFKINTMNCKSGSVWQKIENMPDDIL